MKLSTGQVVKALKDKGHLCNGGVLLHGIRLGRIEAPERNFRGDYMWTPALMKQAEVYILTRRPRGRLCTLNVEATTS